MNKGLLTLWLIAFAQMIAAQPVITANPQDKNNCVDSCTYLRVTAVGTGLGYQWQVDEGSGFVNLMVATAQDDTLHFCDTGLAGPVTMDYRCIVTDVNSDTAISNIATVTTDSCLPPVADFEILSITGPDVCFTNTSLYADVSLWNFGNGGVSNDTDPCYDYGDLQLYYVRLYVFNDYGQDSIEKPLDLLAIEELSSAFNIYPNPAAGGKVFIQTHRQVDKVSVLDSQGREVAGGFDRNGNCYSVDISRLPQGVYTLVVASEGRLFFQKTIKQ